MVEEAFESPDVAIQRWLKGEIKADELFALNPKVMQALGEHGYLLYEQGKYAPAKVIFEALAAVDSNNPNYQRMLGALYQLDSQWDAAYYRYTQVLKTTPNDIFVLTNRGEVLLRLQRTKEAAEDFRQAIQLDRQNTNPAAKRARVLMENFRLS
jgi:tetratricopeptide (TPR) repeat protein